MADIEQNVTEGLHLTTYEIQVLLGTSIHGCNMSPDRVFSLDMAWHRLCILGLIDRADGLAIITEKGQAVLARIEASLRQSPAAPVAVQVKALEWPDEIRRGTRVQSKSGLVEYTIAHYGGSDPDSGTVYRWAAHGEHWNGPFFSYEQAIGEAQADYERRIRSAIETPAVQEGWTDPDSGETYTAEQLSHILRERDKFIVDRGLWTEFVATLPASPTGGAS